MLTALAQSPALWGFLGALCYAAPRLSACIVSSRSNGTPYWRCALDAGTALVVGTVMAEAFTTWVMVFFKRTEAHDVRAIGSLIGLLANPLTPRLIDAIGGRVLTLVKGNGSQQ